MARDDESVTAGVETARLLYAAGASRGAAIRWTLELLCLRLAATRRALGPASRAVAALFRVEDATPPGTERQLALFDPTPQRDRAVADALGEWTEAFAAIDPPEPPRPGAAHPPAPASTAPPAPPDSPASPDPWALPPDGPWSACARRIGSIPGPRLTLDLPSTLYQTLLQTPLEAEATAAARAVLRGERMRRGAFFTPEAIVQRLLGMAVPTLESTTRICDPAMGTGHFLLGALQLATRRWNRDEAVAWAKDHLHGVDRDGEAVRLARRLLWLATVRPGAGSTGAGRGGPRVEAVGRLAVGDALLGPTARHPKVATAGLPWPATFPEVFGQGPRTVDPAAGAPAAGVAGSASTEVGFDAVVGNPPYEVLTRFAKHPEAKVYAEALRASGAYTDALRGQINLYRAFVERGLDLLRPGGRIALVVPASLLMDRFAEPLRRRLLLEHGADRFEVLHESDRAFEGVTQAVALFRARRDAGPAERITVGDEVRKVTLARARIAALSDDLALPLAGPEAWELLDWLAAHAPGRLDAIAEGFVGEVDQTIYRPCMLDAPPTDQASPTKAKAASDTDANTEAVPAYPLLLRGSHLRAFRVDLEPTPGKERFLDRADFLSRKGAAATATLARVARPRVAQLGIRNLESRPRLIAAPIPPGVFCGNSVNCWTPRPLRPADQAAESAAATTAAPATQSVAAPEARPTAHEEDPPAQVSTLFLCGLLNSRLLDWRFRLTSGNNNINLVEVAALPIPVPPCGSAQAATGGGAWDASAMALVEAATQRCIAVAAAQHQDEATPEEIATARAALDEAVEDWYGLPPRHRRFLDRATEAR